ncbi:MAG: LPS export ABC transporter permease LptF [Burkholderiales bacterium]|nr:LPS export ABC transporter permease LptF [Burkholderiales bacterium]
MIFRKMLLRELVTVAAGTFLVLLGISVTTQLVRLLGQAASGAITSVSVAAFLGFSLVNYLPVLLSLTLFISVLLTLSRSYRDSEMVVWFASGVGLTEWIRPVAAFAMPLVLLIALLTFTLTPWAVSRSEEMRRQLEGRDDVAAISPGVFRESRQAERVYFVEEVPGEPGVVGNVFVSSSQLKRQGVMVAARGHLEITPKGDRFLVLVNGRRYEGEPGSAEYRIYQFERYAMRIESREARAARAPTTKSVATLDLLAEPGPANLAELAWRFGLPASALVLALLAIPLSFVNPRAGRSMNLVFALLVYMVYANLLSISQAAIAQSRLSLWTGLWAVHALMLALLLLMFYRRLAVYSLFRLAR